MLPFKSIFGVFLCIFFRFVVANELSLSCPSVTVTQCLNVLKNVFEDERRIREYFHQHTNVLAQQEICENNTSYGVYGKNIDCAELLKSGAQKSGVYTIYPKTLPDGKGMKVYCDMETDDGGWTVIQRRAEFPDNQINFTRKWNEYSQGFGNLTEEFWLGNDNIHILTNQNNVELRVDLKDFEGNTRYAKYDKITVGDSASRYILKIGKYSGTAGDSLAFHRGRQFSTYDNDHSNGCANRYKAGWWYAVCHHTNINGVYLRGRYDDSLEIGVVWKSWLGFHYSLKETEMKIRPI